MTRLEVKDFIEAWRTARGGFTKRQLAVWGVSWPPPRGWKRRLVRRWTGLPHPNYENPSLRRPTGDECRF